MPTRTPKKDKDYYNYANVLTDIWARKLKVKRPGIQTDYKKWQTEHHCDATPKDFVGQICSNCHCMYIEITSKDLGLIHNTVVHELLHFKYPDLVDGPKFDKLVTKTLMGKKR